MRKTFTTLLIAASLGAASAATHTVTVSVSNPTKRAALPVPVVVPLGGYGFDVSRATVTIDGREVASQIDDTDQDGTADELCFMATPGGKQTLTFTVTLSDEGSQPSYPAHTFAEMVLPNKRVKDKNKQDIYISSLTVDRGSANPYSAVHHHGPAFENDFGAFRIYLDHRQTVDLYGKQRKGLELRDTQFYPTKEQKAAGYGDDVLWVGNSFGLGALRGWDGEKQVMLDDVDRRAMRIIASGPVRAIVEVADIGWNTGNAGRKPLSMTTRYTVWEGRRDCGVDIRFTRSAAGYDFATGLVNVDGSTEYTDHKGLRGCWGTAWPVGGKDTLTSQRETVGLAICLSPEYVKRELPADADNYPYVVGVDAANGLRYHVSFTSAREQGFGFAGAKEWFAHLKEWKQQLEDARKISVSIQ